MIFKTPDGMSRRHFLSHLAGASALTGSAMAMGHTLNIHAPKLQRDQKACIMLWMGGGPSTIDMFDMKPGATTGGPFKPIKTAGDVEICEHLPMLAGCMDKLSIVRSMSTREADHQRGRYYMHTGYVPNPSVAHPSYGSVIAHELANSRPELQIPPFVSVGGGSEGPGFLGMAWAPFSVNGNGDVRNLNMGMEPSRLTRRMQALAMLETGFIREKRGEAASEHAKVLEKTLALMTSKQMQAFKIDSEPKAVRERYGEDSFGRGCLMARRLVEVGVPFVEVNLGGWDNHQNVFQTLENNRLPTLDRAMSALVDDLEQRGMLENTVVLWMGEFGRTPRINGNSGRDHWARSWSVVAGGGGLKPGIAIGKTNEDGTRVEGQSHSAEDLMATVCKTLGISLESTFTSRNGRPMKIANSGKVIEDLLG